MHKIQEKLPYVCKIIETVFALFILFAMVCCVFHMVFQTDMISGIFTGETKFAEILESVLGLVIGLEFIEMLCHPDSQTVLEVLIFLIARHMIIEIPSPVGLAVMVIGVCSLCIVRRALRINKLKTYEEEEKYKEFKKQQEKH